MESVELVYLELVVSVSLDEAGVVELKYQNKIMTTFINQNTRNDTIMKYNREVSYKD